MRWWNWLSAYVRQTQALSGGAKVTYIRSPRPSGSPQNNAAILQTYATKPDRGSVFGRAITEGRTIHIPDLLADPDLDRRRLQDYRGVINIRTGLGVPMIREGTIAGVFTLQRREPRAFTDKQIELV